MALNMCWSTCKNGSKMWGKQSSATARRAIRLGPQRTSWSASIGSPTPDQASGTSCVGSSSTGTPSSSPTLWRWPGRSSTASSTSLSHKLVLLWTKPCLSRCWVFPPWYFVPLSRSMGSPIRRWRVRRLPTKILEQCNSKDLKSVWTGHVLWFTFSLQRLGTSGFTKRIRSNFQRRSKAFTIKSLWRF